MARRSLLVVSFFLFFSTACDFRFWERDDSHERVKLVMDIASPQGRFDSMWLENALDVDEALSPPTVFDGREAASVTMRFLVGTMEYGSFTSVNNPNFVRTQAGIQATVPGVPVGQTVVRLAIWMSPITGSGYALGDGTQDVTGIWGAVSDQAFNIDASTTNVALTVVPFAVSPLDAQLGAKNNVQVVLCNFSSGTTPPLPAAAFGIRTGLKSANSGTGATCASVYSDVTGGTISHINGGSMDARVITGTALYKFLAMTDQMSPPTAPDYVNYGANNYIFYGKPPMRVELRASGTNTVTESCNQIAPPNMPFDPTLQRLYLWVQLPSAAQPCPPFAF